MADKELRYTDFEELVFEDRNKEYGAYDLRKSYKWFLTKAFFLGTVIFVAAIILPLVYVAATEGEKVKETKVDIDLLQHTEAPEEKIEEDKPKEDEEIHESKPDEQSIQDLAQKVDDIPQQETVQDLLPDLKRGAKNETKLLDQGNKDTNTGTKNIEGTKDTNYQGDQRRDGVEGGQGNQSKRDDSKVVENKVDTNIVHTSVDVEADYGNGGLNGFRAKVVENFDSEAVQGEGMLTTTVKFVVETNGTVSQVKATGANPDFNREAERVVRSIKGWKPAKKGGVNVRSYYSLPLKMKFE
jgi:tonB family protein